MIDYGGNHVVRYGTVLLAVQVWMVTAWNGTVRCYLQCKYGWLLHGTVQCYHVSIITYCRGTVYRDLGTVR